MCEALTRNTAQVDQAAPAGYVQQSVGKARRQETPGAMEGGTPNSDSDERR